MVAILPPFDVLPMGRLEGVYSWHDNLISWEKQQDKQSLVRARHFPLEIFHNDVTIILPIFTPGLALRSDFY